MIGVKLSQRARRVLSVTVADDLTLSTSSTPSPWFPARRSEPAADNPILESGPRSGMTPGTLWVDLAAPELHAGDRVEILDGDTFEVLGDQRPISFGRQKVGHSMLTLPVSVLYSRTAEVHDLADATSLGEIECSVYQSSESQTGHGDYYDTFADAPASAWTLLSDTQNRELHFDGEHWNISQATLNREVPYVSMALRRAR